MNMKEFPVCEKFLRYVAVDTQSDPDSTTTPTTAKQRNLADLLATELNAMGASQVKVDEFGYVYAEIPAREPSVAEPPAKESNAVKLPVVGLIAHMDTSPDASGRDVHTRVIENYDGGDIVLNREKSIITESSKYEALRNATGKTLIVTDGTTLLGGDDKAGIAAIMQLAQVLLSGDLPHPTVKIAFTPDEEVGSGADHFDVAGFGADYAYTIDGGAIGELSYENFNAASATLSIRGVGIHPGSAKNRMLNSQEVAMEFHSMLPPWEKPEHTEGYEGFAHLKNILGSMEETTMAYVIRDHDREQYEARKRRFQSIAAFLNEKYPTHPITLTLQDSYFNMREQLVNHMHVVDQMKTAMRNVGVEPIVTPIRGGTDGARLSYMGLPCPNVGTGAGNGHGPYEFAVVEDMEQNVQVLLELMRLLAQGK